MADVADAARRGLPWRCVGAEEEEEEESDDDNDDAGKKQPHPSLLRRGGGVHDVSMWELEAAAAVCGRDESAGRSSPSMEEEGEEEEVAAVAAAARGGGVGVGGEKGVSPSWVTSSTAPSPSHQKQHDNDGITVSQLSSQRPNEQMLPPLRAGALEGHRAREILLKVVVGKMKGKEQQHQQRGITFSSANNNPSFPSDEAEGARAVEALEGLIESASSIGGSIVGGSKKAALAADKAVAAAAATERHFEALAAWVAREQKRRNRKERSLQQNGQQWRRVRAVVAAVLLLASASG